MAVFAYHWLGAGLYVASMYCLCVGLPCYLERHTVLRFVRGRAVHVFHDIDEGDDVSSTIA